VTRDPSGESLPLTGPVPGSSFTDLLRHLGLTPDWKLPEGDFSRVSLPEATTVMAIRFPAGVAMVGDRQATEGNLVAHRRIQKVFPADNFSAVAIAGVAGLATEMVRLFQTELEHYEKLRDVRLSLEGKATYLARLVRGQLSMAFQGLVVMPLFCGYDELDGSGRVFSYDVVGGRYEEEDFGGAGSGSKEAKAYLRGNFRDDLTEDEALQIGVEALVAAAEEDVATGGPDLHRGILPSVVTVTATGFHEVGDERVRRISEAALAAVH
jgi:proteasome beta subunit